MDNYLELLIISIGLFIHLYLLIHTSITCITFNLWESSGVIKYVIFFLFKYDLGQKY